MASISVLLFLLCLAMGCLPLIELLITFAHQNPNNSLPAFFFFFVLLPLTFFSATTLLIFHVAKYQSPAQTPLLPLSQTYRYHMILIQLKSMASLRPLLFLALAVAISGLQLLDSLSAFSNQNPDKSFIYVAVNTSLFFLLPFTYFSAIILLLLRVAGVSQ